MKVAKLINNSEMKTGMGYTVKRKFYSLSEPLEGHSYVVVSAANTSDHGPETYIFGADSQGEIVAWGELTGSFVGSLDHEKALTNVGYKVE